MARGYSLPLALLQQIERLPNTRTGVFRDALAAAHARPLTLLKVLERRVRADEPAKVDRTAKVTVSLTNQDIEKLTQLTRRTQLGTEHVLRLTLEAHLERQSQKTRTSHSAGSKKRLPPPHSTRDLHPQEGNREATGNLQRPAGRSPDS